MGNKSLYFECYSGISGDMTVAALLDLGLDKERLIDYLKSLNLEGFNINIYRVYKNSISALKFDVVLSDNSNIETREEQLGNSRLNSSVKLKSVKKVHKHKHVHRNLYDINKIIDDSILTDNAKKIAKGIFEVIAKAESKAHGINIDDVHFHEVGAVDSIVDIVSTAILIDELGIKNIYFSPISEGRGTVKIQHGILPVPVPAVANIFSQNGLSMNLTDEEGEMITPTGAGIAAFLRTKEEMPEKFKIRKIGIGAGSKDFARANILRVFEIEDLETVSTIDDEIYLLETNIDDSTGENMGFVFEELLANGAKDVYYTPIFMKKNRPSYMLSVITDELYKTKLEDIIFKNTTSIGIREQRIKRRMLNREMMTISTKYGIINAKKIFTDECNYRIQPEFEDIKSICKKEGLSFNRVYYDIISEINK